MSLPRKRESMILKEMVGFPERMPPFGAVRPYN